MVEARRAALGRCAEDDTEAWGCYSKTCIGDLMSAMVAAEMNGALHNQPCCTACEPTLRALRAENDRLRESMGRLSDEIAALRARAAEVARET